MYAVRLNFALRATDKRKWRGGILGRAMAAQGGQSRLPNVRGRLFSRARLASRDPQVATSLFVALLKIKRDDKGLRQPERQLRQRLPDGLVSGQWSVRGRLRRRPNSPPEASAHCTLSTTHCPLSSRRETSRGRARTDDAEKRSPQLATHRCCAVGLHEAHYVAKMFVWMHRNYWRNCGAAPKLAAEVCCH